MKHKKKKKFFQVLFVFLFLIYITIYVSESSGYYEFKNYKKASLIKEKIAEFEADLKAGKEVDFDKYMVSTDEDYDNQISNIGYSISNTVSNLINKGVVSIFDTIGKLAKE